MAKLNNTPVTANITFGEAELKFLRALTQNALVECESEEEKIVRSELFEVFSAAIGIKPVIYRSATEASDILMDNIGNPIGL